MEDRKQIMSWLEGLAQDDWPMFHSDSEVQEIAKNALELLKEQEAVKPKCKERIGGFVAGICPTCGTVLNNVLNVKACGKCGQKVKWE